jgi:pimeloyl-ACP methyl ester carboxylesterase
MTSGTVTSKDGTEIAFDRIGEGPPVIFVGGALNDRTFPPLIELAELVATGRRGQAVELFLSGVLPAEVIAEMKRSPMWSAYEAMAHTLVYEGLITGDRSLVNDRMGSVTAPTVVITGADSDLYLRKAVEAIVDALPQGELRTVPGAHHSVSAEDLASVLVEIFGGGRRPADPSRGRAPNRG